MSKQHDLLSIIRQYKFETGKDEIEMRDVAQWAQRVLGYRLPKPKDPVDLFVKELTKAAREETRYDASTGRPYRANHAVTEYRGNGQQMTFWFDIDKAPRKAMYKSLIQRREQMVGDALQLTFDANHWNGIHPDEESIQMPLDFTDDVEWRMNAPDEEQQAG
jgi:hypothetical protein